MTTNYVQALTLYQAGAGNIIGATAVVLTNLTDIYGNAITTMAPFGSIGYITLEPDTTNEEAAIFTGLTVNSNGTVSLTGVSTILAQTPYTATSGLVRQHSGGTKVVITDNVAFWNTFANTNNINTFSQIQTFSVPPISSTTPVNNTDVPNKAYVDGVAVAGAPNANATTKGIVQLPTQAQVDAKTATGSTGAALTLIPSLQRSTLLSDYVADTSVTVNAFQIAVVPDIAGYVAGQRFTFKAANTNTGASVVAVGAHGNAGLKKLNGTTPLVAGDIVAGQIVEVEFDGTNFQLMSPVAAQPVLPAQLKFGGTGADGALSISSGTTTLALASASYFEKNYSSISITGTTGKLAFSGASATLGASIVLRSQGSVTVTSSNSPAIDITLLGGGLGNAKSVADSNNTTTGGGGGGSTGAAGGTAASGGGNFISLGGPILPPLNGLMRTALPAGNGAYGCANGGTQGSPGTGAGGLYIECAGAYNCTAIILASGGNGSASGAGTGGGGGGGNILVLYASLTADSGTYTVTAGTGGGGGGVGSSLRTTNNYFV